MNKGNVRCSDIRCAAMGDLIGWLALAFFTIAGAIGICYVTFVTNEQTAGLDLEMTVSLIAAGALVIGGWFLKNAVVAWRSIDKLDEKSRIRERLLANIVRQL